MLFYRVLIFTSLILTSSYPVVVRAQAPDEYSDEVINEILNLGEILPYEPICTCMCMSYPPAAKIVTMPVIEGFCSFVKSMVGTKCKGYTEEDLERTIETEGKYYCLATAV
jgi:hypothetical protein